MCDGVPVPAVAAFADNGRGQIAELSCKQTEHGGEVIAVALAGRKDLVGKFQLFVVRDRFDLRAIGRVPAQIPQRPDSLIAGMQAFFLRHVLCGAGGDEVVQLCVQFRVSGRVEAIFIV